MDKVGLEMRIVCLVVNEGYGSRVEEKKILLTVGASLKRWVAINSLLFLYLHDCY